jgi:hypothetical protein
MKNNFRKILVAVALVCLAGGTRAANYDWGVHVLAPAQETSFAVGGGWVAPGSFLDTYQFSLAMAGSQLSSVAVAINLFASNITGGSYSLYATTDYSVSTAANDTLLGTWTFDGTTGSTVNTAANLSGGNYFFAVSGAGGGIGGQYMLNSSVTAPVPEPEIYAMLGVGLGLLGWVKRKRKSTMAAA